MWLKNAKVCDDKFDLIRTDIRIENSIISEMGKSKREEAYLDLSGCTILPGFVDIHIHGCAGYDTCDGTVEAIREMAKHLVSQGVTSFLPTTMTVSEETLGHVFASINHFFALGNPYSKVMGIHIEGPFLSPEKSGVQDSKYLQNPDISRFMDWWEKTNHRIKIIDIAPELPGSMDFISHVSQMVTVSLSHTNARYETVVESIENHASHATHLYNAMAPLDHRSPGPVAAIFENSAVTAELICDGLHIHPAMLRLACRQLGEDRTIIVSDSMRGAGCPDGVYLLGNLEVEVIGSKTNYQGRMAGSVTSIPEEISLAKSMGVPWKQVIKSATINPARRIGEDGRIGSISVGKQADLVVMDSQDRIIIVFIDGKIAYNQM